MTFVELRPMRGGCSPPPQALSFSLFPFLPLQLRVLDVAASYLTKYDKTLERLQKAKKMLDKQITRCEWIQRNEKPFTYDSIGIMDFSGLSGAVSLLSLVPPENLNEAMRRLNPKTRKKLKEKCFKPLDIDTSLFERLMDEYTEEYALADLRLVALQNRADSAFVWSDGQDFDEDVPEEDLILPDEDMETE